MTDQEKLDLHWKWLCGRVLVILRIPHIVKWLDKMLNTNHTL